MTEQRDVEARIVTTVGPRVRHELMTRLTEADLELGPEIEFTIAQATREIRIHVIAEVSRQMKETVEALAKGAVASIVNDPEFLDKVRELIRERLKAWWAPQNRKPE